MISDFRVAFFSIQIEIDDCRKVLQKCLNNKTKFDFIINDLSEYLLNTDVGKYITKICFQNLANRKHFHSLIPSECREYEESVLQRKVDFDSFSNETKRNKLFVA